MNDPKLAIRWILLTSLQIKTKDIWLINLKGAVGHEIRNKRPVVVVSVDISSQLALIIPLSKQMSNLAKFSYTMEIMKSTKNKLWENSVLLPLHMKSASFDRFDRKIGKLDDHYYQRLKFHLKDMLNL